MGLRRNGAYTINDTRTTPFPPAVVARPDILCLTGIRLVARESLMGTAVQP